MSFLNLFRKGDAGDGRPTEHLILDGLSLAPGGNGGPVRPSDQLQLLERYGAFGKREKFAVTVLFVGKPLRELDAGGRYREVAVRYADSRERLPALLRKVLGPGRRSGVVVVTGAPEMAAAAASRGVPVMRDTTLRKAVDRLQGGERGAGGGKPSRNPGASQPRRKNNARRESGGGDVSRGGGASSGGERKNESPQPAAGGGIDDLIDLV